jgi:hypothetical protein
MRVQGLGDQAGLGAFSVNEVAAGMAPALGISEAVPRLDKASVDDIAIGKEYATELSQRLPHHRLGAGGGEGKATSS